MKTAVLFSHVNKRAALSKQLKGTKIQKKNQNTAIDVRSNNRNVQINIASI